MYPIHPYKTKIMNITSIVLTKKASETTANARYGIEYTAENDVLQRIQVTVQSLVPTPEGDIPLGYIYLENGTISCNFLSLCKTEPYFSDFDMLLEKINREMEGNEPTDENAKQE